MHAGILPPEADGGVYVAATTKLAAPPQRRRWRCRRASAEARAEARAQARAEAAEWPLRGRGRRGGRRGGGRGGLAEGAERRGPQGRRRAAKGAAARQRGGLPLWRARRWRAEDCCEPTAARHRRGRAAHLRRVVERAAPHEVELARARGRRAQAEALALCEESVCSTTWRPQRRRGARKGRPTRGQTLLPRGGCAMV